MTVAVDRYRDAPIAFATMHGKELLARATFAEILGARVVAPQHLNTDLFGTFSGEIPRNSSPRSTALAKARLGMHVNQTPYGLASEGTFSAGFGASVQDIEVLVFVDDALGIEIVEVSTTASPLPAGRSVSDVDEVRAYAQRIGFPEQWIIFHTTRNAATTTVKDIGDREMLQRIGEQLLTEPNSSVTIEPDYRAHHCPTRAENIRELCQRMAHRLATACPQCSTPGFGELGVEYGVPCQNCGTATPLIAADIHGCAKCTYRERVSRSVVSASPQWCSLCNP